LALGSSGGTLLESEAVRGSRSSRRDGARPGLCRDAGRRRLVSIVSCASEGRRVGGAHLRRSRTVRPLASLARGPLPSLGSAPSGAGRDHTQKGRPNRRASGGERSRPSLDADLPDADRCRRCSCRPAPRSCLPRSSPGAVARPRAFGLPQAAEPSRRPVGREAGPPGRRCRRPRPCPGAARSSLAASSEDGPARSTP
jgi:hypothetical protein